MYKKFLLFFVLLTTIVGSTWATKTTNGSTTTWDFRTWSEPSSTGSDTQGLTFTGIRNQDWVYSDGYINMINNSSSVKFDVTKGQKITICGVNSDSSHRLQYSFKIIDNNNTELANQSGDHIGGDEQQISFVVPATGTLVFTNETNSLIHFHLYSITKEYTAFDFTLSGLDYRSDNQAKATATSDAITLTFKSGEGSNKVTTDNSRLKFQRTTSFTISAPNSELISKVIITTTETNDKYVWTLTGDGSTSIENGVTTWTGLTNGSLTFTNNNYSNNGSGHNLYITSIAVEYTTESGAIATYNVSGNTLTFTGDGRLYQKTFTMTDYTLEIGNTAEVNEKPSVKTLNGSHVAYVSDANNYTHTFYTNGIPTMGSYYTIKPKNDGQFVATVKGEGTAQDDDGSLVLVDAASNVLKVIPYNEYNGGFTDINCGYLLKNKVYYLYSRAWITLYLKEAKFSKFEDILSGELNGSDRFGWDIVEENNFDQYSEKIGDALWTYNGDNCYASVDGGGSHGVYAYYNGQTISGPRSMYYEFEKLESRTRFVIEFDARINYGNQSDSQIALYRTKPNNNAEATDCLLSIKTGTGHPNNTQTSEYKFYVPGNNEPIITATLNKNYWYHYIIEVDARNGARKIGVKVLQEKEDHTYNLVNETKDANNNYGLVGFTGNYTPLGISYCGGNSYNHGRFDNILIASNQGSLGNVSAPTIEVTSYRNNSRTITVTSGISELGKKVTTYYEYVTKTGSGEYGQVPKKDENGYTVYDEDGNIVYEDGAEIPYNWDYILDKGSWSNWTNFEADANVQPKAGTPFELTASARTVYYIRAISTIDDYVTVKSDTAYLAVVVGEPWNLTGGFAVQEMKKEGDEKYYTPTVRAYVDTKLLGNDIDNVNVKLYYKPIDYASNVEKENVNFEYIKGTEDGGVSISASESGFTTKDGITYFDFTVPRSGDYILHISGTGFMPGTIYKRYYRNKYKVTYQTPDFSVEQPLTEFENTNVAFNAVNKEITNRIYGYTGWSKWTMADVPYQLDGWMNNEGAVDYYWNTYTKNTTATLNSVSPAKSGGSTQTYNIRTIQYDDKNPLIIRKGWGMVKNISTPWSYSCALAHIGMGNEIPEFTIDPGKGDNHDNRYKVYPTPFITGSNTPECTVSVPSRAALVQYKVYTPVETKKVDASTGLASFSSYYSLYHVSDYFMDNDELVGTFFAPGHYKFGSNYYISQCWYLKERQGYLLAANIYTNTDIWDGYAKFVSTDKDVNPNPWSELTYAGGTSQVHADGENVVQDGTIDVEIRIIDATPSYGWSNTRTNEIKPVLMDDDRKAHSGEYETIYASSIVNDGVANPTGFANMVLLPGKRNEADCYNFFCLPKISSKARLGNKTAYIQRTDTYQDYLNRQPSVKEEGERIIFGLGDFDEAVGIDMVENNANATARGNDIFYNIAGQKVSSPTKGIYIYNGKKVLVK